MRNLWILAFIDSKRTWKLQISLQIGCVDFLGCLRYHKLEYLASLKSNQTWSNLGRIWRNFRPKLHPITQNPFRKPSPTNFCYSPGTWSPISTKKSGFVLKSWLLQIVPRPNVIRDIAKMSGYALHCCLSRFANFRGQTLSGYRQNVWVSSRVARASIIVPQPKVIRYRAK